jgi:SOS-response transcriptional repressor LexA
VTDDALSGLGLHKGDAVSVDTRAEPEDGDLVVVEAEVDDDSRRIARRYFAVGDRIRLESIDDGTDALELPEDSVIVMGVIAARLRFSASRALSSTFSVTVVVRADSATVERYEHR